MLKLHVQHFSETRKSLTQNFPFHLIVDTIWIYLPNLFSFGLLYETSGTHMVDCVITVLCLQMSRTLRLFGHSFFSLTGIGLIVQRWTFSELREVSHHPPAPPQRYISQKFFFPILHFDPTISPMTKYLYPFWIEHIYEITYLAFPYPH